MFFTHSEEDIHALASTFPSFPGNRGTGMSAATSRWVLNASGSTRHAGSAEGAPVHVVNPVLARSARVREEQPDRATAALQAAVAIIPMAALAHTADYEIVAANDRCATLLQVPIHQLIGRRVKDFIPIADRAGAENIARTLLRQAGSAGTTAPVLSEVRNGIGPTLGADSAPTTSAIRRILRNDGSAVSCWMHVGATPFAGSTVFVACMDLVNPVLNDAHRWRQRADHDELTGLLRRGPLLESLQESLAADERVVFAFSDVDGLKWINDTHGHAAGDHVLAVIGRRLQQCAPPGCLVSRLSGDEFAMARILSADADDAVPQVVAELVDAIQRSLAEPIAWGDSLLSVSMSTGVAVSRPDEAQDPLFARADAAMYAQKTARRAARLLPSPREG